MSPLVSALGALFTSGAGLVVLAAAAALIVLVWDWRLALACLVLIHIGTGAAIAYLHDTPVLLVVSQWLAVLLCVAMLWFVAVQRPANASLRQAGNWLLRSTALVLIMVGWWFIDPGVTLPLFTQPETDVLLWIAICGLLVICLDNSPLFTAIALLLWSVPLFAMAAVLLPGSGLSIMAGVAVILTTLACAYLVLVEPVPDGHRSTPPVGLSSALLAKHNAAPAPRRDAAPRVAPEVAGVAQPVPLAADDPSPIVEHAT